MSNLRYEWEELEGGVWCAVVPDTLALLFVTPTRDGTWFAEWQRDPMQTMVGSPAMHATADAAKAYAEHQYELAWGIEEKHR